MAKHRNAVSVFCRVQNIASACNAGGSSSLHTRMNAAARLMQPLRCAATHLKIRQRSLQHALNYLIHCARACMRVMRADTCAHTYNKFVTNTQHSAAQQARRCRRTCTFFTRPRVTRSITNSAQCHDIWAMCISAGAVTSRRHANATQRSMRRTSPQGEHSAAKQPRGGSACCRR